MKRWCSSWEMSLFESYRIQARVAARVRQKGWRYQSWNTKSWMRIYKMTDHRKGWRFV